MMQDRPMPDRLSDWELPPVSDAEPVRVFDTAGQALAFLAAIVPMRQAAPAPAAKRVGRRLWPAAASWRKSPFARVRAPQGH
jgi:hypothetical protein